MEGLILTLIEKFGYLAVLLLIAIENIFPPIPSEVILLFGGFCTINTNLSLTIMIIVSTIGSLIGAICLYSIGRILHKDRLKKIVKGKIGSMLRLEEQDIDKADSWFQKRGNTAVFVCRFVPIIRSLISIPAGINKMNIFKFILYTVLGTVIWNTVLLIIGSIVGENWTYIANIIDKYSSIVLIALIVVMITFIIIFYKKRSNKKKNITQ